MGSSGEKELPAAEKLAEFLRLTHYNMEVNMNPERKFKANRIVSLFAAASMLMTLSPGKTASADYAAVSVESGSSDGSHDHLSDSTNTFFEENRENCEETEADVKLHLAKSPVTVGANSDTYQYTLSGDGYAEMYSSNLRGGFWTDYAAAAFEGGSGTKEDPYQIATAEQLALLASDVNSGESSKTHSGEYFILTADIDLSAHKWTPLGYESFTNGGVSTQSFSGYFDGNNKKITGLFVDERGKNRSAGLFGCVSVIGSDPVIQNLTVENGTVMAGDSTDDSSVHYAAGILIGEITILGGSGVSYGTIKNCTVSGKVFSNMYAGGLVGSSNYTKFEDCTADVKVSGHCVSGGFAGYVFNSDFTRCEAHGKVNSSGWSTGGFAGIMFDNCSASYCAAFGNVTADDWNIGGFVGYAESTIKIDHSIATGNVTSSLTGWLPKAGGFAGTDYDGTLTLEYCHAAGKVTTSYSSNETVGSMIGSGASGGTALNCSYDSEKNGTLDVEGTGVSYAGIAGQSTQDVLINICNDYYGGHDNVAVPAVDVTCTEDGSTAGFKCNRCGYTDGIDIITASGHNFSTTWESDVNQHWHICTNCGIEDLVENHASSGPATETEDEVCTICGRILTYALGHVHTNHLTKVDAKAPTCTVDGNIQHYKCSCGKLFADDAAKTEITLADVDLKAAGHKFGDWVTTKYATTTSTGIKTRTCSVCDETENDTIPKKSGGSSYRPSKPTTTTENKLSINGFEKSWEEIAADIAKLPYGGTAVIGMNGETNVPADVIKAIKDVKAKIEFVVDSTISRIVDGSRITTVSAADFSILYGNADKSVLRGVTGIDNIINDTGITSDLKLTFRKDFAGQFANVYELVNSALEFRSCVKVDEDGVAVVSDADAKGEYVVMVCEFSDLRGDINNDGVLNAGDASAILKLIIGREAGVNPLMADFNGDGAVNALDASAILKWIIAA